MAEIGRTGAEQVETFVSEWDLSAKQYRAVHIGSADNKVVVCSQVNLPCLGIVMNKPQSGEAARICIGGLTKVIAGDAVTRGNFLVPNALGYLVAATLAGSANVVAWATMSITSGSIGSAIVTHQQRTLSP